MSETLNVNVLVAAKEEYTKQLILTIQSGLYDIIKSIYQDSQKNNLRLNISLSNFQKELKSVPDWASFKLDEKLSSLTSKYPYLMDLITAIFVSHVKILACVRLKKENKSIKIKVPNLNTFLHKILICCSESIYYNPSIIREDKSRIFEIINLCINETISNQIPIQYILSEYLSGVFDEEEPAYPENEQLVESDESEEEPDHFDEEKNIPIVPIQKPLHKINRYENMNDEPEKLTPNNFTINNRTEIEDSDEEPDEELDVEPDEELDDEPDDEPDEEPDEEPDKQIKNSTDDPPTLF